MEDKIKQANQPADVSSTSQVAKRMQQEYSKKGFYNASDLHRVLGNPKDSVGFASTSLFTSANQKRK